MAPVTISAPAGAVSVMLVGVHDIVLRGETVLAAAPQAVWVDSAARISLDGVTVTNSAGTGVQIKGGTSVTIAHSNLVGSSRAGLMDMAQAVGTTLSASTVSGNGKDGQQYNGDGVGLNGTGGSVRRLHDHRATATASASSTASTPARRPTATRSRATRSAPTREPTSRPPAARAWSPTIASRRRCSGS